MAMLPRKTLTLSSPTSKTKEEVKEEYIQEKYEKPTISPKPSTPIMNPNTGKKSFGYIRESISNGEVIPGGEIELRHGVHKGIHSGYGAKHIWAAHSKEMAQDGFFTEEDVPEYVSSIIRKGTPVHYSGDSMKKPKVTVVKSSVGTAVLEVRTYEDYNIWSVITAYSRKNANGPRVGAVE